MNFILKSFLVGLGIAGLCVNISLPVLAQVGVGSRLEERDLKHGIEQYRQGSYSLAIQSLQRYIQAGILPTDGQQTILLRSQSHEEAHFYLVLSRLEVSNADAVSNAVDFIKNTINPVFKQRAAFALAQYYFYQNDLPNAIVYYELAGLSNLDNEEIADSKFELAYSYFNQLNFNKAHTLFAAIKDMPENKYYIAGNYYYGLLSYNQRKYDQALKSFEKIHYVEEYKDVVPYYEAELHYFLDNQDKVLDIANRYLRRKGELFYRKEMHLLRGQVQFERKNYLEALPDFEYFYNHSDKIRKEIYYEHAYVHYKLENWHQAIDKFKPLSNSNDSLGQTSMYLLGDCYLKIGDKKGARNAFAICSEMNYNPSQKEAAKFLYAKLSYELGDAAVAARTLNEFVSTYPYAYFIQEAKSLLTALLAKSSNFAEAFAIISDMVIKDDEAWELYQQVAVGRALQLLQNQDLQPADSILSLSLQQPIIPAYEAVAYFWKAEIAYREKKYPQAIQFARTFLNKSYNIEQEVRKVSPIATTQNAHMNIGYSQMETGNYHEAQAAFKQAHSSKNTAGYSEVLAGDAIIRNADALLMQKNYRQAIEMYQQAMVADFGSNDYARYQIAIIQGIEGNNEEKTNILRQIRENASSAQMRQRSTYELAMMLLENNNTNDAIVLLEDLVRGKNTNQEVAAKAYMRLAYAHQLQGELEKGINYYKLFVENYPSSSEKNIAIEIIRNLYISMGQPQEFAKYIQDSQLSIPENISLENTFYETGAEFYGRESWQKAAYAFADYLHRFSEGVHIVKANYYLAEAYANQGMDSLALPHYENVLTDGWSEFAESAAAKAAMIHVGNFEYEKALKYYLLLKEYATDKDGVVQAYSGMLKSAFEIEKYEAANLYADTLLAIQDINEDLYTISLLYKAKSLHQLKKYKTAESTYEAVAGKNKGTWSAEAHYRIAEIYFEQDLLEVAEKQAEYAVQLSAGQDYWVVKNYLLLAAILTLQEDYFNAKATLQSIIKNATIEELKIEAKERLEEVLILEKTSTKLQGED